MLSKTHNLGEGETVEMSVIKKDFGLAVYVEDQLYNRLFSAKLR